VHCIDVDEHPFLLERHLKAIRANKRWRNVPIFLVVENNMGNEARTLGNHVRRLGLGVHIFRASKHRGGGQKRSRTGASLVDSSRFEGIYTDNALKETGFTRLKELLRRDSIRLHKDCISAEGGVDATAHKLSTHLLRIRRFTKVSPNTGQVTVVFSGKMDENGKVVDGQNDDAGMALGVVCGVICYVDEKRFEFEPALASALSLTT